MDGIDSELMQAEDAREHERIVKLEKRVAELETALTRIVSLPPITDGQVFRALAYDALRLYK